MLTVMYVVILAFILFCSAGITRSLFAQRVENRFNRVRVPVFSGEVIVLPPSPRAEDMRADFLQATIIVDGLLLFVAGVLSYWLAGFTLRPIQAAYNCQRQFLSDVSHELRTPLAILRTGLENELDAEKFSKIRPEIESHLEEVDRMSQLIGDFLVLSRLDSRDGSKSETEIANLQDVVQKTVNDLRSIAERQNITLTLVQNDELALPVSIPSKELLVRAIANVINNAIAYNHEFGSVQILTKGNGRTAILSIKDTGVGIAAHEQKKVFDRFYRAEKSRTRHAGGSGLGLPIVKSIIDSLGGSVALSSEVGRGTEVIISLPIHKAS